MVLYHHFGLETAMTTWQRGCDAVLRISPAVSKVLVNSGLPVGFKAAMDSGILTAVSTFNAESFSIFRSLGNEYSTAMPFLRRFIEASRGC